MVGFSIVTLVFSGVCYWKKSFVERATEMMPGQLNHRDVIYLLSE